MIENMMWLAFCVYFEARGEPIKTQVAVAHVILNRANTRKESVKTIIIQPHQFSWYKWDSLPAIKDYNAFVNCCESVYECLRERLNGETFKGADHFYSDDIKEPYWAVAMEPIKKIGRIYFFKS
jgi:spore germination cell wall hydrolase CwlJ-like protein